MSQQENKHRILSNEDNVVSATNASNPDNAWKAVGSPPKRRSIATQNNEPIVDTTVEPVRRASINTIENWGSFQGFQWEGSSIVNEPVPPTIQLAPDELLHNTNYDVLSVPMLPGVSLEPIYRQHRSLSFSMGQEPTFFGYDDYEDTPTQPYQSSFKSSLAPMKEEEDAYYDDFDFIRSRSKSSGAAFGLLSQTQHSRLQDNINNQRRRSSSRFFQNDEPSVVDTDISLQRRLSQQEYAFPEIPVMQQLTNQLENTQLDQMKATKLYTQPPFIPQQDKDAKDLGKGVPLHRLDPKVALYMVEFKGGRTDFFYVLNSKQFRPQIGDLVIVEGDRGKDLGKVAANTVTVHQVTALEQKKQEQLQQIEKDDKPPKELHLKRIFRLARPEEIHMLLQKGQDEHKALVTCKQKTKQKKLPMEVVDAEYQWDRKKLTFYFESSTRIDFRELVRELFKTYKTRIWMCVVTKPITVQDLIENTIQ